jgi:phage anti-repressor protein
MNELIAFDQLEMIAQSTNTYPVNFDDAWQWVGYTREDNALRSLKSNFIEDTDYSSLKRNRSDGKPGKPYTAYHLTTDCFKSFCMMAGTDKGKEVRRYFLDVEKRYKALVQNTSIAKLVHRDFTDVIRDSGLNEIMHGFAYKQFTDLVNKAVLGMDARRYRETNNLPKDAHVREYLTPVQLTSITKIEKLVGAAIEAGADYYQVKAMITGGIGAIALREYGGAA